MPIKPIEMKARDFNSSTKHFGARTPDALVTFPFGKALVRQAEVLKIGVAVDQNVDDPTDEVRHIILIIGTDTVSPGGEADGAAFSYMLFQDEALSLSEKLAKLAADMGESTIRGATRMDDEVTH